MNNTHYIKPNRPAPIKLNAVIPATLNELLNFFIAVWLQLY